MLRIPCLGLMLFALPLTASVQPPSATLRQTLSVEREQQLWKPPLRSSEFADIPHTNARSRCEDTQPPQALATPNPLLVPASAEGGVKVSFIVGTDGRVHSPLILKSAGPAGDRNVLQTIRAWRYRPATCNGVPTESEARIEFSQR
jgi:TonB family protein